MKKFLSIIFSLVLLICTICTLPIDAFALTKKDAKNIFPYSSVYLSVSASNTTDIVKFTPYYSGYYEFVCDCIAYNTIILGTIADETDEVLAQSLGDSSTAGLVTAAYLEAGNTYYFELEGTGAFYSTNVTVRDHYHNFAIEQSYPAVFDGNDAALCDDGGKYLFCSGCGEYQTIELYYYAVSASLKTTKFTYNGKKKTTTVTVKDRMGNILPSTAYTVTYKNNTNPGYATATITLNGSYSGRFTKTFTIKPKKMSISSLTQKKSKSFIAKWKKDSKITGYQVRYSTSKKFNKSKTKTVNISSKKTTSKTIKKLKNKKTYYVQIRSYKTSNGKKIYSDWSKTKTIKIKY